MIWRLATFLDTCYEYRQDTPYALNCRLTVKVIICDILRQAKFSERFATALDNNRDYQERDNHAPPAASTNH